MSTTTNKLATGRQWHRTHGSTRTARLALLRDVTEMWRNCRCARAAALGGRRRRRGNIRFTTLRVRVKVYEFKYGMHTDCSISWNGLLVVRLHACYKTLS